MQRIHYSTLLLLALAIGCDRSTAPPTSIPETASNSLTTSTVTEPETAVVVAVAVDPAAALALEPISKFPVSFPSDGAIRFLGWNIESDGANPDVIADELDRMPRYDVYGFSEVRPLDFAAIKERLGDDYVCRYSKSGRDDRLAYAVRKERFEITKQYELETFEEHVLNPGNYRSPYVTEMKDKTSDIAITVVLNHLARGKAEIRQAQAEGLRAWAASLGDTPLIALGDYNFDYVFATDKGNEAMDIFMNENVFKWVRPVPMIDSNWYDGNSDGIDDYPGSLLDFAFLAGKAKEWKAECRVIVRERDFPDDLTTSDHRPSELTLWPMK